MASTTEVHEVIEEAVESTFMIDSSEYDDDTSFGPEGLDAESLDVVEMAEHVEDATGVHIPDDELEELATIGEVKTYVADELE